MSGDSGAQVDEEEMERIRTKVEDLKTRFGFIEPDRGNLDDPEIEWRHGKPDYTKANYQYFKGKTQNHKAGSLEELVENLVKTWESQASHYKDFSQWTTVDTEEYKVQVNGGEWMEGSEAFEIGNYNALMKDCPAYNKFGELSFEESHNLFRGAFTDGFPWEVLKVMSGPPHVHFTWRHWGHLQGSFQENQGHGEMVEMYGLARVTVTEQLKIQRIEVYYDPETFIKVMEGVYKPSSIDHGKALLGDISCPFVEKNMKIRINVD